MKILNEVRKNELIAKSRNSEKGRQRYARRRFSVVSKSNREYNKIDMNKFFKEDILDVGIVVRGETDTYTVSISFGDVLGRLQRLLQNQQQIQLNVISRALIQAFNSDNVYIRCSCPDANYRFNFWQSKNDIINGPKETRPSNKTNPHDTLGSACKHVLLVLSNSSWLIKVASVIRNYINYMEKHQQRLYADIIYPAIFGKPYEEPVQLELIPKDNLASDELIFTKSNDEARERSQFQKGNTQGVRFLPKDRQISLEEPEEEDEE